MERGYNENVSHYENVDGRTLRTNPSIPLSQSVRADPAIAARERKARVRAWAYERAQNARSGLVTMSIMADWAIRQAVRAEPNRAVRHQRKNILSKIWNRYNGDLVRQSGRLGSI